MSRALLRAGEGSGNAAPNWALLPTACDSGLRFLLLRQSKADGHSLTFVPKSTSGVDPVLDSHARISDLVQTSLSSALTPERPHAETQDGADPFERRMMSRSIPLESRSSFGWWEGKGFVSFNARLLDISRTGVAVEMDHRPPNDRDVWFRLQAQCETDSIWGEVVDVKVGQRGRHVVRIAFWSPYPDRLCQEALHGPLTGESCPDPSDA